MTVKLTYPKTEFKKDLENYIEQGKTILTDSQKGGIKEPEFLQVENEFKYWRDEVLEFLKQRFDNPHNEYYNSFNNATADDINSVSDVMRGANPQDIKFRFKYFKSNFEPKIQSLISLNRKLNLIPEASTLQKMEKQKETDKKDRTIFISHSSLDSKYVEKIIDTLEIIGVPSEQIFCSSFEGYGVKLGKDFLNVIKNELNGDVFVLFILSSNFYSSVISLCEMGATWIKANDFIPVLIPPFDYEDVKGVIPTTHGMKINEKEKYNTLKEVIETYFSLSPLKLNVWERKRDNILKEMKHILDSQIQSQSETFSKQNQESNDQKDLSFYDNLDKKIKELSKKEWSDDFEMQLDYIQNQKSAIERLKTHHPIDIPTEEFQRIRENARQEWPNDYEMQLDHEQRQVESLRRLNEM